MGSCPSDGWLAVHVRCHHQHGGYVSLPPEKTGQASALINVARILGGSIGISLANMVLVQNSQMHLARLVEHITPTAQAYRNAIERLGAYLAAQGAAAADAHRQAIGVLAGIAERQASILAYADVFRDYAMFALTMVCLAFLLRAENDRSRAAE